MKFLNKITFLFRLFISSTFLAYPLAYPMDNQSRDLKTVVEIISTKHNSKTEKAEFFSCLERLPIDFVRKYRTTYMGNSLLHLSAIYGKPLFVARLLVTDLFNLYEENNAHVNPCGLAIRNIENQSNSRNPDFRIIKSNLKIIEIIANKDEYFYAHFSYVLFLLIKCLVNSNSDDLFEIIDSFYHRYYEYITVDELFDRTNSFDLLINNSTRNGLILTFLKCQDIDARILNNQLEYLLLLASQNPETSFLDAILEQSNLDRYLLCELVHDGERGISKEIRGRILSFIRKNCSNLLTTPGGVVVPDKIPEFRPIRRSQPVSPDVLAEIGKLDLSDFQSR